MCRFRCNNLISNFISPSVEFRIYNLQCLLCLICLFCLLLHLKLNVEAVTTFWMCSTEVCGTCSNISSHHPCYIFNHLPISVGREVNVLDDVINNNFAENCFWQTSNLCIIAHSVFEHCPKGRVTNSTWALHLRHTSETNCCYASCFPFTDITRVTSMEQKIDSMVEMHLESSTIAVLKLKF